MIRTGKAQGWLQLPTEAFLPWALLNDVSFDRTVPGSIEGKGGALLARENLDADKDDSSILLTVPRGLILSLERVREHAKIDRDFRDVLEQLGDFGQTPRGAILSFLLLQASVSYPDLPHRVGVHTPFTDYIKSLPLERLPTFWTTEELQLLTGTSLAPAISAKLKSLRREYDNLCAATEQSRWYQAVQNLLDFDDWLRVDAMYRSRALDFPGIGHCMVPGIDVANHASGDATVAIYEKDADGNAILLLRDGKKVLEDAEVTITYGDEKGASEMLFSYGFLEPDMQSAKTLFLSLSIPDTDRFRIGKMRMADCAPGFRLTDKAETEIEWEGDFIWLLCLTDDDDLQFALARTVDGQDEEMQALFEGHEITNGAAELHTLLSKSPLWDVYRLRAVAILQQRVFEQLQVLYNTQAKADEVAEQGLPDVPNDAIPSIMRLRALEFALLEKAYEWFEGKKLRLAESPVVVQYLASNASRQDVQEEDFS